jgi:glycosyltransferase involved in cell wall biosynthesis
LIRVGFVIALSDGWIGGANYFRSLLSALYENPERKIEAVIFTGCKSQAKQLEGFLAEKIVRSRLLDHGSLPWLIRKLWQRIFKHDLLLEILLKKHGVSVLSHSGWLGKDASIPTIGWIPDFQHVHLPELFDATEIALRDRNFQELCQYCTKVIVSSYSAQSDFANFSPEYKSKSEVLQFAVSSQNIETKLPTRSELEERYQFVGNYFLLPNQFWRHKNHRVVIEALGLLKREGKNVLVLATGSTEDYRSPQFFSSLMARAKELDVLDSFRPLGLVPAHDLATLMRYASALINPSYFEGWSTSVEEAKSLGKRVVVSDIAVHREQNPPQARFFPPDNSELLANILWGEWHKLSHHENDSIEKTYVGTNKRRMVFAQRYQKMVLNLIPHILSRSRQFK